MGSNPTRGSSFFFGKVTVVGWNHARGSFFFGKVTALQLGVLCCFALLFFASFFFPSAYLSNMYKYMYETTSHAFQCVYIIVGTVHYHLHFMCMVNHSSLIHIAANGK